MYFQIVFTFFYVCIIIMPNVASIRLECYKNVRDECYYASKMARSFFNAQRFCVEEGKTLEGRKYREREADKPTGRQTGTYTNRKIFYEPFTTRIVHLEHDSVK